MQTTFISAKHLKQIKQTRGNIFDICLNGYVQGNAALFSRCLSLLLNRRGVKIHVFIPTFFGTGLTVQCTFHFGKYRKKIRILLFLSSIVFDVFSFVQGICLTQFNQFTI